MELLELNSMTLSNLRNFMLSIDEKPYRGEQLFTYFNRNQGIELGDALTIPLTLRKKLEKLSSLARLQIVKKIESKIDDTVKYLFALEDNNLIESVLMKYEHGKTVCISTQVGCRMGCSFCASTKGGWVRNLTPAEMLNQIYLIEKDLGLTISNLVLMGSGEPLDNYDNTLSFIKIIHDPKGHDMSYRNISLSTCGIVPRIYDLANEGLPITLSVSLHSPFDHLRESIMPVGKRYKIKDLLEACRYYLQKNNRRLTFEYTLIEGFNDRQEDIWELKKILKGLNVHINLIPLNPIKEYKNNRPGKANIRFFQDELKKARITTTLRQEKGADISGSCGQLRRDYLEKGEI